MTALIMDNFWTITLGNLSTIIIVLGAFMGLLWKTSGLVNDIRRVVDESESLNKRLNSIDSQGTSASRLALRHETELTVANNRQIQELSASIIKILPDIAEIKTDLEWVKNGIRSGSIVRVKETHIPK